MDFSKVYKVDTCEISMFSDAPKNVAELDRKLGTDIFSKVTKLFFELLIPVFYVRAKN